jgi:hypothetical protein
LLFVFQFCVTLFGNYRGQPGQTFSLSVRGFKTEQPCEISEIFSYFYGQFPNYHCEPESAYEVKLFRKKKLIFKQFHFSGDRLMESYYNYAKATSIVAKYVREFNSLYKGNGLPHLKVITFFFELWFPTSTFVFVV